MRAMAGRLDESMPVGNEGAGVVVKTGSSDAAKALMGKTVAMIGGAMYAQYRTLKVAECLPLPAGTTPAEGASCFVNPLTALGMIETMRREGHKALVHTAAASNLGQMLNKICLKDGIGLVNIVRSQEQADILRKIGAQACRRFHRADLHGRSDQRAGGNRRDAGVRRDRRRQAGRPDSHLHGGRRPTRPPRSTAATDRACTSRSISTAASIRVRPSLNRAFGMAWGVGGWLLFPFLQKIGPAEGARLRQRVVDELKTTFASHYTQVVSLQEALQLNHIAVYGKRATGEKYLINPNKS